jgi:hypothetical protein
MRYLYTKRGNAQFGISGLKFETFLMGRTWHGTAMVGNSNLAQIALDRFPQIEEITRDEYDGIKKNETIGSPSFQTVACDPTRPVNAPPAAEPKTNASDLLLLGN